MKKVLPFILAAAVAALVVAPAYAEPGGKGKGSRPDRPVTTQTEGPSAHGQAKGKSADAPGHNKVQVTTPSGNVIWVAPPAAEHAAAFNRLEKDLCEDLVDEGDETVDATVEGDEEQTDVTDDETNACDEQEEGDENTDEDTAEDVDEDTDEGDTEDDLNEEETELDLEEILSQLENISQLVDQLIQQILASSGV